MKIYLYSLLLFILSVEVSKAQLITGPTEVCAGVEYTYTYHGTCGNCFLAVNGIFVANNENNACSLEGGPLSFKVVWTADGYFSVPFCNGSGYFRYDVTVHQVPVSISANPSNGTIGLGQSIQLIASGGYSSYSWSCNNPGNCHIASPSAQQTVCSPTSSTTYKVTVSRYISSSLTCSNSASFNVTVLLNPIVDNQISGSQYVCPGSPASPLIQKSGTVLSGGNGTYSYQWQRSVNEGVSWSNIAGATSASYYPGVITSKNLFRRIVYSGAIQDVSNFVTLELVPNNLNVSSRTFSEDTLLRANDYVNITGTLNTTSGAVVHVKSGKSITVTNTSEISNTFVLTIESCAESMRYANEELPEFAWTESLAGGDLGIKPFPNPVSNGRLNFGQKVADFALYDNKGSIVREGKDADGILVDHIAKGMYLLKIDNQIVKIFVQ